MLEIRDLVNDEATKLGIEIVDVRIKRADLPEANSQAVYELMRAERKRIATEIRAEGAEPVSYTHLTLPTILLV